MGHTLQGRKSKQGGEFQKNKKVEKKVTMGMETSLELVEILTRARKFV